MRQARYRFFLLPLLFVLACVGAFAQANSELTGIVTDQTGAVVAGATVVLTDPATGCTKTTESGATGLYDINGLNPANYNLKVTAKGFEAYAQNGVVVNVSSTARVDVKLTVGAETQTVTVEADALAVQTDSNVVSTLISSEQISEIATAKPQLRRSGRTGPRRQFRASRQQHADLGGSQLHHQRQRTSPEPQHLADRRRRSR